MSSHDHHGIEFQRDAAFLNNSSCVALQMGLPHAALLFARKGLQKFESGSASSATGANSGLALESSAHLIYNCGVILLKLNQPLSAFKCLERVIKYFKGLPTLWLRLAECCIYHDLSGRCKDEIKQKSPVQSMVSSGQLRRLLVRYYIYIYMFVNLK